MLAFIKQFMPHQKVMPVNDSWPDWCDGGKSVEIRIGCHLIVGKLYVGDFFFNGEEEVPLFEVQTEHGINYYFSSQDDWRFI